MREGLRGHTLFSQSNRRRLEHWTWVPPGLTERAPVVILLHGVDEAGGFCWWEKGFADVTAARLVADGSISPFCLVMPGDTGAEHGSGYTDWYDGTTCAETYIMRELLPWIDSELPSNRRVHIGGLSMGGYGALLLALRHPGVFRSASATSAFFDPLRLFRFVPDASARIWRDEAARLAHDVCHLVTDESRRAGLRLALDCGLGDHLLDANRDFHAHLQRLGVAHGYVEQPGGHEWDYWGARVGEHLRFHVAGSGDLAP